MRAFLRRLFRRPSDYPTAELPAVHVGAGYDYADDLHDWTEAEREPDPHGWSVAARGWDYQAIFNAIVDGFDPTPCEPALFDALHAEFADRLALPTAEHRELVSA